MTDDLVKDLRTGIYTCDGVRALRDRAADRIEKLTAANLKQSCIKVDDQMRIEKLETALREIIDIHPFKDPEGDVSVKSLVDLVFHINLNARKALEGKENDHA